MIKKFCLCSRCYESFSEDVSEINIDFNNNKEVRCPNCGKIYIHFFYSKDELIDELEKNKVIFNKKINSDKSMTDKDKDHYSEINLRIDNQLEKLRNSK